MTIAECPALTLPQWRFLTLLADGADDRRLAELLLTSRSAIGHRLQVIYPLLPLVGPTDPRAAAAWYVCAGHRGHAEARRDA